MSTEDERAKQAAAQAALPPTKVKVEIDRSPEVEAIRKEADDARKALETATKKAEEDKKQFDVDKKTLEDAKKKINDELEEKKGILAQQALTEFEKEKASIMDLVKDSKLTEDQKAEIETKIQDPKSLATIKSLLGMMVTAIQEPAATPEKKKEPTGKATITPPIDNTGKEHFEDKVAMIDELYKRAYDHPELYTSQEVADAKFKIDTLFKTLIGSKSWSQLKAGQNLPIQQIMSCPKCNRTFVGELPQKCPTCLFNFTKTGDFQKLV